MCIFAGDKQKIENPRANNPNPGQRIHPLIPLLK